MILFAMAASAQVLMLARNGATIQTGYNGFHANECFTGDPSRL